MRAEWIKMWTTRAAWWCLASLVVLTAGLGMLMAGAAVEAFRERTEVEPVSASLQGGLLLGQVVIGVLGVLVVTSEYATGTMQASVVAVPRRGLLFAAKALVATAVATVAGEAVAFASFLLGQQIFAGAGMPHAALGDPGVLWSVAGAGLYLGLLGLAGVAIGFLARSTAGGVIIISAATVLVVAVLRLLPEWVARVWPTVAGMSVITPGAPLEGFAIYLGFVALLVAAALGVFLRQDVRE